MAYTDCTLEILEDKFGIKNQVVKLFDTITPVKPSVRLKKDLDDAKSLPLRTEKARSECIVVPILKELWKRSDKYFTIYSGENFSADIENGLDGVCDFILAKDIGAYAINYPIMQVVQAKENDLDIGIPQCAAQMFGTMLFNKKKSIDLDTIYGCVTTGNQWQFMCLEQDLKIDRHIYYLNQIDEILGAFQYILDYCKTTLK